MTRRLSLSWPVLIGSVGAALAVLGLLLSGSIVSAGATATIDGGTWTPATGATQVVKINATGLPSEGLGASDISVAFDSKVLKITACDEGDLAGACNLNAPDGPANVAGFDANGIKTEPAVIAELTFDCIGAAGSSSALTITVNEFVDATVGDPQAIAWSVTNGSVTCGVAQPAAAPATGSTPPDSSGGTGWIIALAAALGAAGLGVTIFGARSLRKRN